MIYPLIFERDDGAFAVVEIEADGEERVDKIIDNMFQTMPDLKTITKCVLIEKITRTPPEV